jgi:hypothetical protein
VFYDNGTFAKCINRQYRYYSLFHFSIPKKGVMGDGQSGNAIDKELNIQDSISVTSGGLV